MLFRSAWLVYSSSRFAFSFFALSASMAYESASTDLGGQIRRVVLFFLLVAGRWWLAMLHATAKKARISLNKVRAGSIDLELSGQLWARVLLLFRVVLWWLEFMVKRRFASFHMAESLVSHCIFFDLSPLLSGMDAEFDGGSALSFGRWGARFGRIFRR